MMMVNEFKDVGNGYFKNGVYDDVVVVFMCVIEFDVMNYVLYSN